MKRFLLVFLSFFTLLLTGCADKIMGYSVVLWNLPEYNIQSGELVPVYIKSNISHVYVIGTADGNKVEVPLWQITEPVKKSKSNSVKAKYTEFSSTYAFVKMDGLPARAEAVNTAKQVYRLRKNEVVKILYKGKGQAPMTGGKPLEGDWYRILTDNGTQGWCFSYNLGFFETDVNGNQVGGEQITIEEVVDTLFDERIALKTWYPDYYSTMISSGSIDLSKLKTNYNFVIDTENSKVTLNLSGIHESWTYDGYTRTADNEYTLKGIPIIVIYKRSNFIVIRYTDDSGKPQEINLVTIDQNLEEIILQERQRRSEAYMQIWAHGPIYESSSYGKITFNEDGSIHWTNFKLLVPSIISSSAKHNGSATVKYSISKTLAASYDGVLTFSFKDMAEEVNFFYKVEPTGLRLEDATGANLNGNQFTGRGSSPLILFFKKN